MSADRPSPSGAPPFWTLDPDAALRIAKSRREGLTAAEAEARAGIAAAARLGQRRGLGAWRILARQVMNPLVLMLVVAAALSFGVGSHTDAVIILAIIAVSTVLGFVQERAAGRAVLHLLDLVAVRTAMLRGGVECEVAADAVVPGDVMCLRAGDLIPADGVLIEAHDLHVDEATLTGESFPVEKTVGAVPADASATRRTGAVFLGAHVLSGTAHAVAMQVGRGTTFGGIVASLAQTHRAGGFDRSIQHFGLTLARIAFVLVVLVFSANVALHRPVLDSFMFSLALAVGLVPELLPAVVAVCLARGATRMAKSGVVVKRLPCIEDFGALTVLCCDKTGTLTAGEARLETALGVDGAADPTVLGWAAINAALETGLPNPIDRAIRTAAPAAVAKKLDEIPYDFVRKRLSVLVERDGRIVLVTKGAYAQMLAICTEVAARDGTRAPLASQRAALDAQFQAQSARGSRVLAVAIRVLPAARAITAADEAGMALVGLLTFADPPKPGVEASLAELRRLGVKVTMITGDNRAVAATVAEQVGMGRPVVVTGQQLAQMRDEALATQARGIDIFAEIEPHQKERIIRALQRAGEVVGYLGDGVNDAPALHAADVGISVEHAADVAKDAADVVLLHPGLDVLIEGVREGRRTFANTLKYVSTATSANFGNMLSMAGAVLFIPFMPLLPKQILLNNLLSDIPEMAIAGDTVEPERLLVPSRWDARGLRNFMIVFGALSSVFDYLTFIGLIALGAGAERFRSAWFLESIATQLLVFYVVRTRRRMPGHPSRTMSLLTGACLAASVAVVTTPIGRWLGFEPLPAAWVAAVFAVVIAYLAGAEMLKQVCVRRGWFHGLF